MIYLIGFMGSGKSTIAKLLSDKKTYDYVEMDEEIEKQENMTIADMFAAYGEGYFRKKETEFMKSVKGDKIISTGGGVILSDENRSIMKNGTVVYLQASWDTIVNRLTGDTSRPLWTGEDTEKKIRFEERLPLYESIADEIIAVDGKDPEVIANEIIQRLK